MKKILIIEDNQAILENTAEILELSKYEVYTASNGLQGIDQAVAKKPDLILCDIMMPILDGYGVLHLVQKNHDLKETPFIFLTARAERRDMQKGIDLGADDYISKPFDAIDLLNAIEKKLNTASVVE